MSKEVCGISTGVCNEAEGGAFKISIVASHLYVVVGPDVARAIATDLLIQADRADKFNEEDEDARDKTPDSTRAEAQTDLR